MARNKLSIYLIKEGVNEENIFDEDSNIQLLKKYNNNKKLYYIPSWIHSPRWLDEFFGIESNELQQTNSRAILIDKLNINGEEKTFALTFGYSKNLFAEDVIEEQFGLKIVLNTVGINDIRKISKISVGSNQKQSQEQMPKATNINEFGFDLERDLIKSVTGKCNDKMFEKVNLIGGDIFSILVERDINNIDEFLIYCYKKYKEEKYKENFEKLSNQPVKVEDMGKKKLAYEIQGNKEGHYAVYTFFGKNEDISDIERNYRIDDNVMKFITVKMDMEAEENPEAMEDEDDMEM